MTDLTYKYYKLDQYFKYKEEGDVSYEVKSGFS